MFSYRVTKYNPKSRNEDDIYNANEWSSYHDIGKVFDGDKFTKCEYLLVEGKYINAVLLILGEIGVNELRVKSLEKYLEGIGGKHNEEDISDELMYCYNNTKEGDLVNVMELKNIIKLILRENMWCKLELKKKILIHFGYDYYMYIGCNLNLELIDEAIGEIGLYIEEKDSPYL